MPRELPEPPAPDVLDFITSQAASEHGYLLPPQGVSVYRRTAFKDVYLVSSWEADAVHHLLSHKHLTRGEQTVAYVAGARRRLYTVEA